MDFGTVLYKAQKNEQSSKQNNNYYKTSFAPPKKETREKKLSLNIQKFLARKEEEERAKRLEAERKKQDLLALRNQDKKSFKRVQSMLKRTKSANKSVLEDAVDNVNTAVTAVGPLQPDEDDYGYVSKDASDLYNKLISKYSNMPPDEPKFSKSSAKSTNDILNTKDRVKAALQREEDEKLLPRKRKRRSKNEDGEEVEQNLDDEEEEPSKLESSSDRKSDEKSQKPAKFKIPKKTVQLAPPMDFQALLKLAEKKQHEPIMIEKKVDDKPERPMTEKEKQEYYKEHSRKTKRETSVTSSAVKVDSSSSKRPEVKMNGSSSKRPEINPKNEQKERKEDRSKGVVSCSVSSVKSENQTKKLAQKIPEKMDREAVSSSNRSGPTSTVPSDSKKLKFGDTSRESKIANPVTSKQRNVDTSHVVRSEKPSLTMKPKPAVATGSLKPSHNVSSGKEQRSKLPNASARTISDSSANPSSTLSGERAKMSKLPQNSHSSKSLESKRPIPSQPVKQFPPPDLLPHKKSVDSRKPSSVSRSDSRQFPPRDVVRKRPKPMPPMRRKFIESDDEYDSEMDDFIDDSEDVTDVSRHISEIFGYDRSRYSRIDEEDEDECMESNFSQLQKEEFLSTKYGILEDLADVRRTKLEKERKKKRLTQSGRS